MRLMTRFIPSLVLTAGVVSPLVAQSKLPESPSAVQPSAKSSARLSQFDLDRRWREIQLDVGHAGAIWPVHFASSLSYWQDGFVDSHEKWGIEQNGDLKAPQSFKKESTALIKGDCDANLALLQGGMVHIYGDVKQTVDIREQGEIVIGGSVLPGAAIEADGIQNIFIGGDLRGEIRSKGSLHVWIRGNLIRTIYTGDPSTEVHVQGDLIGQFKPTRGGGLLWFDVEGFMPYGAIEALARLHYTEIRAHIAFSDHSPGIYPARAARRQFLGLTNCCWTIHAHR
jgi:hypothetical protein